MISILIDIARLMENGLEFVLGNALENYTDIPPEEKRDRKKQTVLLQVRFLTILEQFLEFQIHP